MATITKPALSEKTTQLELPVNFIDCVQELSADGILVLIAFFQWMSKQEQASEVALVFDFKASLPALYQTEQLRLQQALDELHKSGLLFLWTDPHNQQKTYLIPGTPRGLEIFHSLHENPEQVAGYRLAKILPGTERPNLFKLYEDNFGALTPMMAETIKVDMDTYAIDWIEDAMKEAVEYNARNWKYVQAILRNWQEKGRKGKNEEGKRDLDQFRKLYLEQKRHHKGG
ncbi:MAG: DnaD domain protein [Anaerolineaceae bacterium]